MQKKKIIIKRKSGFTLIELLLVVGFISLAGIGIYIVYSKVQASQAALTEVKNLETIKAGVRGLYGGNHNYTGVSASILNDARITPDSMRKIPYILNDPYITNSFGGGVAVQGWNIFQGWSNPDAFRVTYLNVPGAVCAKLVTGAAPSWDRIAVNGAWVKTLTTGGIDISTLSTQCASDTGSGVSMVFDSF